MDTFNTGVISNDELLKLIKNHFNFTPSNIRKELDLGNIKFRELSKFGHVGRSDLKVKWEHPGDKVEELIEAYEKTKSAAQLL